MLVPSLKGSYPQRECKCGLRSVLAGLMLLLLSSCTTSIQQQGGSLGSFDLQKIKVGVDTKETIAEAYGQPSTKSIFRGAENTERWYYTHRVLASSPLKGRRTLSHRSIVFTFAPNGTVQRYGVIEGEHKISVNSKTTKELGYKTNLLKEMFRNVGKFGQGGNSLDMR